MQATTLKLEHDIIKDIKIIKPSTMSLSAFVRSLIKKEVLRSKLKSSAKDYLDFIDKNPDEQNWLREWGDADLSAEAILKPSKKKKK